MSPSTTAAAVLSTIYKAMKYEKMVESSFGRTEEVRSRYQVNLSYIFSTGSCLLPNHIYLIFISLVPSLFKFASASHEYFSRQDMETTSPAVITNAEVT